MKRKITHILGVASAIVLITLLALGTGWHPDAGVNAAPCSVSGVISTDTTWSPATCDPYIVTASVVVPSGVTLTIEAGTTVKFDSLKGLLVQGILVARGTATNPITFTSNRASPARGDWSSISFGDSSTDAAFDASGNYVGGSVVQYAVIEYAGSAGSSGALNIEASSPWMDHNTIRNNGVSGVYAPGSGALRVTYNTIANNTGHGISAPGTATIANNTISNNTHVGVSVSGRGTNTITNNTITNNAGGGISRGPDGTTVVSNNTIIGNSAAGVMLSAVGMVSNNTITGNTSGWGGGIAASGGTISNNTITGNTASRAGGGVIPGGATISNNTIAGNTAPYGGGIYNPVVVISNTITDNRATEPNGGGGIYVGGGRPTINDNDLYSNMSGSPATPNDLYNGNRAGSADVDAEDNYWGTTDPGVIEDHIWHFPDDSSRGLVDYFPFRTTPVGANSTPTPTPTSTAAPSPTTTPTPTPTPPGTPTPTPTPMPIPSIRNLSVTKITNKDKVFPGDAFTYLLFLENSGPESISVALTDTIPTGASYITNTVSGGAVYSPTINGVLWSGTVFSPEASTLPSQVFQFRVRIDPDVSTNAITNTVLVSDGAVTTTASVMTEVWRRTFAPLVVKEASGW